MKPQKSVLFLCLLLVSSGVIQAGLLKHRQSEIAMLLAGGLLTLLFREGSGMFHQNLGHDLTTGFGAHSLPNPMMAHGHHHYPGFGHGIGHHMAGSHHPFGGLGRSNMMSAYGQHLPLPGMNHASHMKHLSIPGFGHSIPYRGIPSHSLHHNLPIMMHGPDVPLSHNINPGHGISGISVLRNDVHDSTFYPSVVENDEDFRQIFRNLERRGSEAYSGFDGRKFMDPPVPAHYEEVVQERIN